MATVLEQGETVSEQGEAPEEGVRAWVRALCIANCPS